MPESALVRASDFGLLFRLIGECRELGDDPVAWRQHFAAGLARLADADLASAGEMAGCRSLAVRDLGLAVWAADGIDMRHVAAVMVELRRDPAYAPAILDYLKRYRVEDGTCLTRKDIIPDADWLGSHDQQAVLAPTGLDHILWCFGGLAGPPDEHSGVVLTRAAGKRDFSARDRAIIREAHAAIVPLVGGALARFGEPSPADLTPRERQVLAGILRGEADKQIALRLGVSIHNVNQRTKALYRHFGVAGRAELLARWVRRGWGRGFAWEADAP